jgi:haloacetate dehalogenase
VTSEPFAGFEDRRITVPRGTVRARVGGDGPPVLLLHGWPETHLAWHAVAPALAERYTVVAADLPGCGGSLRPPVSADHAAHAKRALALDLVAAMFALGHDTFAVAGHDRGGRVAYRMALDFPQVVTHLAALDVVPTGEVWRGADAQLALGYWHWSFLAQAAPLPERLVLGRAGATIDRAHDEANRGRRRIACPTLALWAGDGALPRFHPDPLEPWRIYAPQVTGRAIAGAGHFLMEEAPEAVATELSRFLAVDAALAGARA